MPATRLLNGHRAMKIGIDARFATHPQHGGFRTYTRNLIAALMQADDHHSYVLYTDRRDPCARLTVSPQATIRPVGEVAPWLGMPWREQVQIPLQVRADGIDVFHSPAL